MNSFLNKIAFFFGALLVFSSLRASAQDSLRVSSPNGNLTFQFSTQGDGVPTYEIRYKDKPVIMPSGMGLLNNPNGYATAPNWNKKMVVKKVALQNVNTTWKPMYGERELIPDHYHELTITIQDTIKVKGREKGEMQVIVRAYDEGIAFRYFFPESTRTQVIEIGQEDTHFRLPPNSQFFSTEHAQGRYELCAPEEWQKGAELPLTIQLSNGLWASILHAQQTHFPRLRLRSAKDELVSNLYGEIVGTSPFGTPWRVVMVAEKPTQLLENNYLILNLNPPSQIKEAGWIRPGRVMRETTLSTDGARKLVDFAVEQNLDFIHFDAGWYGHEYEQVSDASKVNVDPRRNPVNDLDMPAIIRYAKEKGKGVILYVNHRALENQLDSIFPLYEKWGVAGVKFGFVHSGSHYWTAWMHEAVKKAAQYHLMVDIHDEYMPTGFSRTYPNLMTQEGVSGNEEFPDATHNTILPFTRFLAGAADYTYCFGDQVARLKNTKAHQLALSVINYSPWQYLYWYGKPEHYTNREEIELWKTLPTTWNETRVPEGMPGEYITVARRHGKEWYLGAVTNNLARSLTLEFDFLPKGKKYTIDIYEDTGEGGIRKTTKTIQSTDKLHFALLPKGGVAVRLRE
ncbi:glycoside hydrolase family 97 protein [Telluribacter sp.]|jgi:alpha-glucosidase|uniref:glycoside hydrolase family 97 protein n=1 Tax=Telluribacter sp. TaxID=1978767 RepID=UPI002E0E5573|nr:glycoside hydrolase family 97 catalytic domain-containing protein [Telluribacter sp.]